MWGGEIPRLRSEWHLGERRKDGSPHARGQGGSFHPHPNLPPSRGKGGEGGRPRGAPLRGKGECGGWREWRTVLGWRGVGQGATRLFAGPRNGTGGRGGKMGSRMREGKGGVFTPILTFPPQGGRDGKEGDHKGRPYGGRGVLGGGNGAL